MTKSPTLFNVYINAQNVTQHLEQSAAPGLAPEDTEIKLLYAADLALLPASEHLPTSALGPTGKALPDLSTEIMIFQRDMFTLGGTVLEHTMQYTYLSLAITASESFSVPVNA